MGLHILGVVDLATVVAKWQRVIEVRLFDFHEQLLELLSGPCLMILVLANRWEMLVSCVGSYREGFLYAVLLVVDIYRSLPRRKASIAHHRRCTSQNVPRQAQVLHAWVFAFVGGWMSLVTDITDWDSIKSHLLCEVIHIKNKLNYSQNSYYFHFMGFWGFGVLGLYIS